MTRVLPAQRAYIWLQVEVSVAGNGKQCSEGAVQLEGVQLVPLLYLCVCVCVCGVWRHIQKAHVTISATKLHTVGHSLHSV